MEARGRQIILLKIEIDGVQQELAVHVNDDPGVLAKSFCKQYSLHKNIYQSIVTTIDENIEELIREEVYYDYPANRNNIGARMHYKGLQYQRKHSREINFKRELNNKQISKELTFQPKICPNSIKILHQQSLSTSRNATYSPAKNEVTQSQRKRLLKHNELYNEAEQHLKRRRKNCNEL